MRGVYTGWGTAKGQEVMVLVVVVLVVADARRKTRQTAALVPCMARLYYTTKSVSGTRLNMLHKRATWLARLRRSTIHVPSF